jgi:hypothetical protein
MAGSNGAIVGTLALLLWVTLNSQFIGKLCLVGRIKIRNVCNIVEMIQLFCNRRLSLVLMTGNRNCRQLHNNSCVFFFFDRETFISFGQLPRDSRVILAILSRNISLVKNRAKYFCLVHHTTAVTVLFTSCDSIF